MEKSDSDYDPRELLPTSSPEGEPEGIKVDVEVRNL